MDHERAEVTGSELIRWIIVAALVMVGIVLFFYFVPDTQPVVSPTVEETVR